MHHGIISSFLISCHFQDCKALLFESRKQRRYNKYLDIYLCVTFQELELYKPELVNKPAILIINKIDTEGAGKLCDDTVTKVKSIQGDYY